MIAAILCMPQLYCMTVSATSYVYVEGSSDGGSFNMTGSGSEWGFNVMLQGFDWASVDLTNAWGFMSEVKYVDIGDGEIYLRADKDYPYDPMYYYTWKQQEFTGNGEWNVPTSGGGRYVNVTNSPNVKGMIEYPVKDHKAVFQFDTRHSHADLRVIVHNGELLENATVTLINGNPEVKWTDEDGIVMFTPGTGTYHMIIEAEGFDPMLVDDLLFESSKSYLIKVHMKDCLSSVGSVVCGADAEDLIIYYKNKPPAMNSISPQGYVNYFAERLRTCRARDDPEADGTLERMATKWGILPDPPLNVLLYSCNFTKIGCLTETTDCQWNVTFTVKNYQKYPCNYTVSMIVGNTTVPLKTGDLGPTWSSTKMETVNTIFTVGDAHDGEKMYLAVVSDKIDS